MPSSIASSYGRDGLESRRSSEFSIQTHETDSSSVGGPPCEYEDSWSSLKNATESLVDRLIRQRRQDEIALEAWSARCRTLEEEVARLADLLHRTEIERDAIVTKPPAPDRPSPGSPVNFPLWLGFEMYAGLTDLAFSTRRHSRHGRALSPLLYPSLTRQRPCPVKVLRRATRSTSSDIATFRGAGMSTGMP